MREIKFRAWDKYEKDMFFVNTYFWEESGLGGSENFNSYSGYELMQWTGLLDKNGVEIYEGDIVVHHEVGKVGPETKEVMWSEKDSGFIIESIYLCSVGIFTCGKYGPNSLEVIGNKFENPELLKDA